MSGFPSGQRFAALCLLGPLGLGALGALGGCGGEPAEPRDGGSAPASEGQGAPQLSAVVQGAIDRLQAELESSDPLAPAPTPTEVEAIRGPVGELLEALGGTTPRDSMRPVLMEELVLLGDAITVPLAEVLNDAEASAESRNLAAEALAALDSVAGTDLLLQKLESSRKEVEPDTDLLAQCAWRLSSTSQDWIVPRVILCLKYETDYETVLWLTDTLARFGNYSGLEGLGVIATTDNPTAERAAGLFAKIVEQAGCADGRELQEAWSGRGERELPTTEPSQRLQLETWKRIQSLAEWQLRGVDDARFVLSRSAAYTAPLLARALADEDVYIRVHSAQCLERMGPRGAAGAEALLAGLNDPRLAPAAAAALGGLEAPQAATPLEARLAKGHPLELRVAAARALGNLQPTARTQATLMALTADSELALDMRAAAAGALVRAAPLNEVHHAVTLLRDHLGSIEIEVTEVEAALVDWIARRDEPQESLDAWFRQSDLPRKDRAAARAELIDALLATAN